MRIQRAWRWLLLDAAPLFAVLAGFATQVHHLGWLVPLLIIGVVLALRLLIRAEVELTADRLVEHVFFRQVRHTIAWSRVQRIDVRRSLLVPQVRIVSDDGGVHYLAVPRPKFWFRPDAEFDAAYLKIGQWWLEHRGAVWRPLPADLLPPDVGLAGVDGLAAGQAGDGRAGESQAGGSRAGGGRAALGEPVADALARAQALGPVDDPWVSEGWVWQGRSRPYPRSDVRN